MLWKGIQMLWKGIQMLWKVHCNNNMAWFNLLMRIILNDKADSIGKVKPVCAVTCIERSPFSCPFIEIFI